MPSFLDDAVKYTKFRVLTQYYNIYGDYRKCLKSWAFADKYKGEDSPCP